MSLLGARCLDAPPAGWGELLVADPGSTPAHRPELWDALTATLPGFEVRVIAAESGGALCGGAPVLIERRAGMIWLHALPFLLSGAPLANPGAHAAVDRAVAEALAGLQRERRAAGGEWTCYRPGRPIDPAALEAVDGETRLFEASVIALDQGLEEARRRMDRKTRNEVSRALRAGMQFEEDPAALEQGYALHARQSRRWKGHRALPLELSRRLLASGTARLFAVRDARGLLCATLALDGPHEVMLWWSGAHEEARASSAYGLMVWSMVGWAHAAGRARVNLGASAGLLRLAQFKHSLGARPLRYPVRWLSARHAPPLGRLVASVQARLRRGRARGAPA